MKVGVLFALGALVAAAGITLSAAAATPQQRIVYRSVRLSNPQRPPEVSSVFPNGQGRRLLARSADQAAWSPGRSRIAFAGAGTASQGIWVMRADGRGKRRLTTRSGDGEPTWSPDGKRIAFRRDNGIGFDLWVVPTVRGKAAPLLRSPRANELSPDWSPDGGRIAYTSNRSGTIQIWVLNLRARYSRQLTRGRLSFSPDWSPDGKRIAYATQGRVAVVDVARPRPRLLPTGTPVSADSPTWSPDGKQIAFQRGGQVLTIGSNGRGLRYVTRAAWGTNGDPDW